MALENLGVVSLFSQRILNMFMGVVALATNTIWHIVLCSVDSGVYNFHQHSQSVETGHHYMLSPSNQYVTYIQFEAHRCFFLNSQLYFFTAN